MTALRCVTVTLLLLLAACAEPRQAPSCSGPIFPLNVGLWQPGAEDLQ